MASWGTDRHLEHQRGLRRGDKKDKGACVREKKEVSRNHRLQEKARRQYREENREHKTGEDNRKEEREMTTYRQALFRQRAKKRGTLLGMAGGESLALGEKKKKRTMFD